MLRLLSAAFFAVALLLLPASRALAMPAYFDQQCAACHPASAYGNTCNGCHAHGTHSDATKSDINFKGTTDKSIYAPGELVTVTLNGGYQSGWLRTVLLDQNGTELGRTTGPNTMGAGPGVPTVLSGPAPTTPGMYTWQVRWFGNSYDVGTAEWGKPGEWIDDWQPGHGYQIGYTNSFYVGSVAKIALAPPALDFGAVSVGGNKSLTTSIQNIGNASMTVSAVGLCAGTSTAYTTTPAAPYTIAPGASQTLTVRYAPTAAATDTGCIAISSNDPAAAVTNLNVTGVASVPTLPMIALAPNPVQFGYVKVGLSLQRTVGVSNTGTSTLSVTSVTGGANAAQVFTWSPSSFTVAPGATQTVTITYAPLWAWIDDNTLTFNSNASNTPAAVLNMAATGYTVSAGTCTTCHGDATRANTNIAPAPPVDTKGNTATAVPGVGAHQNHLASTRITGVPVACTDCHQTPNGSHPSGTVFFLWSSLAKGGTGTQVTPSYDFVTNTCTNYCHGATLAGGTLKTPKWTQTDGTQAACGTCHGIPPPTTAHNGFTSSTPCGNCHTSYTPTTVNAGLHMNGQIDVMLQTCTSCHGDSNRVANTGITGTPDATLTASPPVDTAGSTTSVKVGDHVGHVNPTSTSQIFRPLRCTDCHPNNDGNLSHSNSHIDVTLGTIGTIAATEVPSSGTTAATCTTYCHGAKWPAGDAHKGSRASWAWNGPAATCGDCHADPPTSTAHNGFTAATNCGNCHTGYTATTVNQALHINGTPDVVAMTCTSCHGTLNRVANAGIGTADTNLASSPPVDTTGSTTSVKVGDHLGHVNPASATQIYRPLLCNDCHPNNAGNTSHSNKVVDVTLATIATVAGSEVASSGTTAATCTTYCHGAKWPAGDAHKGTRATWAWNGAAAACGDCHADPPTSPAHNGYTSATNCGNCHTGYTATTVNKTLHINGTADVINMTCTTCHGTQNRVANSGIGTVDTNLAASPPLDTAGTSTGVKVGDHLGHVNPALSTQIYRPLVCTDCHPNNAGNTSHSNNRVDVTLATIGTIAGAEVPSSGTTAATCTTYCHGAKWPAGDAHKGVRASWAWNGAAAACGDCHADPPTSTAHNGFTAATNCGNCHNGYTATTVNKALHINGTADVNAQTCTSCHGTQSRVANSGIGTTDANLAAAPPVDASGSSTSVKVGNHVTHVNPTATSQIFRALVCTDCHPNNAGNTSHSNGVLNVTLQTIATYPGSEVASSGTTAATCTTYCHGSKWPTGDAHKGARTSWAWNGAAAACGDCHAYPPTSSAHSGVTSATNCGGCHTGYTNTTVNLALHINGVADAPAGGEPIAGGTSCGTCHSTLVNSMLTGSSKVTKHTLGGADAPTPGTASWTTGANLKASSNYASANCVSMCHGDHPHTVSGQTTHQYNAYLDANNRSATADTTTRGSKDFDATSGGLCTSCHKLAVDATHPAVGTAFAGTAHQFTSKTVGTATYTWQYTLHDNGAFGRDCTKCHASQAEGRSPTIAANGSGTVGPHASDFGSLLAGTLTPGATPANLVCYNCHGNGTNGVNLSGKDLATAVARGATTSGGSHRGVQSDTIHATASEASATWNNGAFSGTKRHVNCADCHDQHKAKTGLVARATTATSTRNQLPPSMTGATGVNYTTYPALPTTACASGATLPNACVTQTTASSFGTSLVTATLEYQVCFKCHSSFAFGNTTYPTATGLSGQQETDVAAEFSPTNRSGHPVVTGLSSYTGNAAPKALVASQLIAPWNTNVGTQTMLCSDCHNTDAASPAAQGPHGSAITYMLAGTNKAWPYTVAGANSGTLFRVATSETGLGTNNGLFCRNCHPQMNNAASNSLHRNSNIIGGQHGNSSSVASCTGCHVRLPHGGKISRLWVTTNAPARYKLGTANFAQMTKNATKDGYSASGFPTGFKSSCGQHSSGTGNESW
ncbi:MAG TPA: CxxxxCH/CxxCH domain-containing protein [Anaeromyxobacteraceae bacterium]|nr:CxxxxCH/CxxCH domain-containing protein [Anaeromyxobacteraceae bacterium]